MCSNCNGVCGGRNAIAYENLNDSCGCGNGSNIANENGCGCGCNASGNGYCGCGNTLLNSLAKGFACTSFQIARGLDRSLSCSCGGHNHNGCGCN